MKKLCAITTVDITLSSFVVDAMRKMQNEGYDVTLISSMSEEFIQKYKDEFHCINLKMSRGANLIEMFRSVQSLYLIFRKERFDYIQYATPNASLYASIAAYLIKCPIRVYCQWGIRYVGFKGLQRKLFKFLEIITCRLSTHIRPASYKNLLFAVSEGHYPQSKASIIGAGGTIGVDLQLFDHNKKGYYKSKVLEEYPLLKDKFVYGFIGRMDKDKGVNELFMAFLKLFQNNSNVALLFIGPEDKMGGIDKQLYQLIKETGCAIFTGYTNAVVKYISAFDVLVHPSYREGFSMVIQQAMAMDVAVVTTNIPGPSEVIENNISGLLVEAKNSEELYSAMLRIYKDDMLRNDFVREGYKRASNLFDRNRMLNLTCIDRKTLLHDL